uniref:Uncharacterized protein n=1 Tax=Arundo donax TaxID=35708 RepID=A0A0A9AFN4_ARUDO
MASTTAISQLLTKNTFWYVISSQILVFHRFKNVQVSDWVQSVLVFLQIQKSKKLV